jgi:hypothetical protein
MELNMNTKILTLLSVFILLTPTVAMAANTFTVNYNILIASFTVEITAAGQTAMNFSGPNTNAIVYPDGTNGGTAAWGKINNTGGSTMTFNISAPTNTGVNLSVGSNSALSDAVLVNGTPASPTGWGSIPSGSSANIFAKAVYYPNIVANSTTCTIGATYSSCNAGTTSCNGVCVNTQTDTNNCGGCGFTCAPPPPNAASVCVAGTCTINCNVGYNNCAGACVNLNNDAANCGSCGRVCASGHTCNAGVCV